jgi:uncharacterized protein (TIGR03118 family)
MSSKRLGLTTFLFFTFVLVSAGFSQTNNSYQQTNLVSDVPGTAAHTDSNLVNAWGISFVPQQPIWIANNGSGTSTIYDGTGATALPPVTIPPPTGGTGPAPVTGTVANTTADFSINSLPIFFIFATEDGTISGWSAGANALLKVDNSAAGAVYKGLAIGSTANGNFLYATNFRSGKVDVFDRNYNPATLAGNFSDPNLPAGYAPFGIQNIGNNQIVVTYALQDSTKHDDVAGPGNGFVDLFDTDGRLIRRVASQQTLNSPWGIALAPTNFGDASGALLIGNFGDGHIMAFDLATGNPKGKLNGTNGLPLSIDGLWALEFGGGGAAGDPNSLYFTAGTSGETHGLFGSLSVASAGGADFTVGATQSTLTVARGGSSSIEIDVTGMGGFTGSVALSCTGLPSQTSCDFSPPSVTAGSAAVHSTLTVSAASTYARADFLHMHQVMLLSLLSMGVGGFCFVGSLRRRSKAIITGVFGLLLLAVVLQTACGGGSRSSTSGGGPGGGGSGFPMTVNATGGGVTHTTTINVQVQ